MMCLVFELDRKEKQPGSLFLSYYVCNAKHFSDICINWVRLVRFRWNCVPVSSTLVISEFMLHTVIRISWRKSCRFSRVTKKCHQYMLLNTPKIIEKTHWSNQTALYLVCGAAKSKSFIGWLVAKICDNPKTCWFPVYGTLIFLQCARLRLGLYSFGECFLSI